MTNLARSISRNLGASVIARVFTGVSNLILAALVGRYEGKTGLGMFTTALYLVSIAQVGVNWGLNTLTPRELATAPDKASKLLLGNITLRLLLTPIGIGILLLIGAVLGYSGELVQIVFLLSLSLFVTALSLSSQAAFMGFEHLEYYTLGVVLANVLFLGLILLVGLTGSGLKGLLAAYLVFRAVEALIQGVLLRWRLGIAFEFQWVPGEWISLFRRGVPFFLLDFLVVLGQRIDVPLLTSLSGPAEAGEYAAAYRIVEIFLIVVTGLNEALLPVMARLWHSAQVVFIGVLERILRYLMLVILPLVIGISVFAEDIIGLFFPGDFQKAPSVLQVLVPVLIPWFLNAPLTRAILATDNQRMLTQTMGLRLIAVLGLNLILVPYFGVYGTAIATVVAILSVFVRNVWFVHRHITRLSWVQSIIMPLVAGLVFALVVLGLPGERAIRYTMGLVLYLAALVVVRVVGARDLVLLREALSGRR